MDVNCNVREQCEFMLADVCSYPSDYCMTDQIKG